jgi:hypothetical protein
MAAGLETTLNRRNLDSEFMNCEQEREKRNTHTHKEKMTEKSTDERKVSNEIKAPDLEQISCNWKNFDRRRVRESAIATKKQIILC